MAIKHTEEKLRKSMINYIVNLRIKDIGSCDQEDLENVRTANNLPVKDVTIELWTSLRKVVCTVHNQASGYSLHVAKVLSDIIEEEFRTMKNKKPRYLVTSDKKEGVFCG